MFDKQQFLAAVARETRIIKHLFKKLPEGSLEFSLGTGIRSTTELLRYLTRCGIVPARCMQAGDWSQAGPLLQETAELPPAEFPAAMDAQLSAINDLVGPMSAADLESEVKLPWGETLPFGVALVRSSLQFLTAYRMQLFLHAKAAGNKDLNTYNCWMGQDAPPQG